MSFTPLPDIEAELVAFLAAHASLSPLHGGRVGTELQEPTQTALQVTALGGPQPWPWEAVPEVAVMSWGGSKAEASTLDRTVRAVIFDWLGQTITGGRVTGLAVRLSGLWTPAEDTGRPRYRSDFAITVMP